MRISNEISRALLEKKPVVALESTIITHGMPYPENVKVALAVEEVIRSHGAIPATIALIEGEIVVGLTKDEIETLAKKSGVLKVSRRDLSYVVGLNKWGSTTVAATMIIAESVGIKIFVTGGIGGVHRGAATSFDISSDLEELARTNVTVICAGPKAILDLPLTLEYLETKGVPVLGYKTDKMPLFYTMSPTEKVLYNIESVSDLALVVKAQHDIKLKSGILVVNPIPKEHEIHYPEIEEVINEAIRLMKREGISGKEETPYLLSKISELTKSRSLEANKALILNNAKLGALLAKEMAGK